MHNHNNVDGTKACYKETYFIGVNPRGVGRGSPKVDKGGEGGSPKVDIKYGNFVYLISFELRKVKKAINCVFQYILLHTSRCSATCLWQKGLNLNKKSIHEIQDSRSFSTAVLTTCVQRTVY